MALSLKLKTSAILLAFLAVNFLLVLVLFSLINSQTHDAKVINLAGAQRMLSQKMSKEAFEIVYTGKAADGLKQTTERFNTVLSALQLGNTELGIPNPEDEKISTQLAEVDKLWQPLKENLSQITESGALPEQKQKALQFISEKNPALLTEMNTAVSLLEAESTAKIDTMKTALLCSVIASLVLSFLGYYWAKRTLVDPIVTLRDVARGIAAGDLTKSVQVSSNDEIGELQDGCNGMVASLRQAHEAQLKEKAVIELKVEEAVANSELHKEYLAASISYMLEKMQQFAHGNLSVSLTVKNDDEIGKLFSGFNAAVERIREMIFAIRDTVEVTLDASNTILSGSQELSLTTQEVSNQVSEINVTLDSVTKTIFDTSENATKAAEASNQAGKTALEGEKIVGATVDYITQLADVVKSSTDRVHHLGQNSEQIGEIIQVIQDIAEQTNLLALNAAIEAARAGEQGRGFAVVADEVKKLSERTSKATQEISSMIKTIQGDTIAAVTEMNRGAAEVNTGREKAQESKVALNGIKSSTGTVLDIINQVAAASEEQSSAVEQMSKNLSGITNAIHETAQGIKDMANATGNMNTQVGKLANMVDSFVLDQASVDADKVYERTLEINKAIAAHMQWKFRIRKLLLGEESIASNQVLSHFDCALGKMYYNEVWKQQYAGSRVYEDLGKVHETMHNALKSIVKLRADGKSTEAYDEAEKVYKLSAEVVALLRRLSAVQVNRNSGITKQVSLLN
jgi:methyl-accepting chemotaxis protein